MNEFESERLVLKNMVTVTESVMEDQKVSLSKAISEQLKANETLKEENQALKELINVEVKTVETKLEEKEILFENVFKELVDARREKENAIKDFDVERNSLAKDIEGLKKELSTRLSQIEILELQNKELADAMHKCEYGMCQSDFILFIMILNTINSY